MSQFGADRNLLFGILAMQMDFISKATLIDSMNRWVLDKTSSLGELLVKTGAMSSSDHDLLSQMVDRHIAMHQGQADLSLASLSSVDSIAAELISIEDEDLSFSIANLTAVSKDHDGGVDPNVATNDGLAATRADSRASSGGQSAERSAGTRYEIVRPHAEGGLGRVSVALDHELNREVALKEIKDNYSDEESARLRFTLEAEITGGLEHPGIVPVYGLGFRSDGKPFYAMRFVKGDSLKQACADFYDKRSTKSPSENSIEFRNLLRRFVDVCNAVGYAHSRGILHRDLKPGNVMLGKYGETLVVDWGLAKAVGKPDVGEIDETTLKPRSGDGTPYTQLGTAVGTPRFMSPEQASGDPNAIGPVSDVYSLGATLYYLLVNRPPFVDELLATVLKNVRDGKFPSPREIDPGLPKPLDAICLKSMSLWPEDRYQTAGELASEIERWLADEPIEAMRESVWTRGGRWLRHNRKLAVALATSLVVVSVISVYSAFSINRARQLQTKALGQTKAAFEYANQQLSRYPLFVSDFIARQDSTPALARMRNELLEQALQYYVDFIDAYEDDPHLELAVSDAYDQLAKLQSERGNKTLAEDIYRQSVQRWQSIHEGVGSQNTLDKLVIAHTNLGLTLNQLARQPEAIESYNKAINLLSNLEEANRRVESSRLLADALDKRAIAMMQQGDLDSAIESYQHSAEVYKLVISRKPDHPEILSDYSNMCSNLGIAFAMSNRTMKARERFKEAKEICERLVELYPDESEYRYELAGYLANLARSLNELGEPEQSEKFSLESIGHLRQVSAKDGRLGYRSRLIVALSNFANFLRDNNRMKEALSFYEEAIPQSRQLIEDQPDVPGNKRDLARLYNNLGRLHESQNRISEALGTYRDSRDLRQELVDAYPDSVDFRHGLGLSENGLGTAYVKSGDHLKAEACFERANAIFERLVNENPNVGMYQESKGWALAKMGFLHLSKGQYPEAKDWMIKTVASRRALVEADREIVEYRNLLGGALNDLGIAQRELGEFEQASRSFQEAIEHQKYALGKNPNRIRYREYLGEHHIELALTNAATLEFDRIAQDVDSFLELWPGSGRRIFDFATRLAAKADAEVMQEKGIPQATEFVEQVKRLTRSASNLEDFDVPNLSSLPQFDAVLSMPEFRKFASELETDG